MARVRTSDKLALVPLEAEMMTAMSGYLSAANAEIACEKKWREIEVAAEQERLLAIAATQAAVKSVVSIEDRWVAEYVRMRGVKERTARTAFAKQVVNFSRLLREFNEQRAEIWADD